MIPIIMLLDPGMIKYSAWNAMTIISRRIGLFKYQPEKVTHIEVASALLS
jgi:hypothetical protein